MLNIVSIVIGLVAFAFMAVGLVPLFGWMNYAAIPCAVVGGAVGALSSSNAGRNFNIFILVVGTVRLWLGGFFF